MQTRHRLGITAAPVNNKNNRLFLSGPGGGCPLRPTASPSQRAEYRPSGLGTERFFSSDPGAILQKIAAAGGLVYTARCVGGSALRIDKVSVFAYCPDSVVGQTEAKMADSIGP